MSESSPSRMSRDDLETWSALATVLEWLPPALDAQLSREFDLTHFEYGILFALAEAPDRTLRLRVLADFANSTLSRLSRAVSRLETRGWVRRVPDPDDGRSTLAELTDGGWDVFARATPGHEAAVDRLVLDVLTGPQRRQLRDISRRIMGAIRDEDGWRAG
ncbi:MarR family winged helix-turn-helix transcriptional regulator [Agromyces sp. MMS24-K17]|uniref:MarR family winged helix-turn-helix transcriptional regulator n=1 Tax=Agromyces sp. MMS24-K17 TaxID=3372850 RepID=UPI003754AF7B